MPQEVDVLKNREQDTLHDKEWTQKITRWAAWLFTNKDQAARDAFSQISDPHAIAGLKLVLKTDSRERARTQYIDTLARIGTHPAVVLIATRSVEDTAEEVRMVALDYLRKAKSPDAVSYLVGQLRSKDNVWVNRAAVGLGYLGDRSAVGPLIDALITPHKFKIVTGNGNPNSLSSSFIPGGKTSGGMGGAGMGVGGGTQIVTQHIQNPSVLDALVLLTGGVNYGFDVRAWKYWYTSLKERDVVAGRRGKGQ
jgi:HEAT repeat protein